MTSYACDTESRCMERVYCGLSPEIAQGTLCMILESFLDETTTGDGSRYTVAGYIASLDDWKEFTPAWYAALKQQPRLGYYRTTEALILKGQFKHFHEQTRNERLKALAKTIPNKGCLGINSSISKADFAELRAPNYHSDWEDPYHLCASWLIVRACLDVRDKPGLERIDFFFDRQGKIGRRFERVWDVFLKPALMMALPLLGKIRFEDKRDFLPLQAADMQAGWLRRMNSTIQTWTSADIYLSQIEQRQYPIERQYLENSTRHQRNHADELAALWAAYDRAHGYPPR